MAGLKSLWRLPNAQPTSAPVTREKPLPSSLTELIGDTSSLMAAVPHGLLTFG